MASTASRRVALVDLQLEVYHRDAKKRNNKPLKEG